MPPVDPQSSLCPNYTANGQTTKNQKLELKMSRAPAGKGHVYRDKGIAVPRAGPTPPP
jgi:hypothetical protein